MVFQYEKEGPKTALEKKYDLTKSINSEIESEFDLKVSKQNNDRLSLDLKPNKYFIEEFKKRRVEEKNQLEKQNFLNTVDDSGNKLVNIYNTNDYKNIHDPLNLWAQSSDKLGWKVFNNVDDKDIYLRTLYYPFLRTDDYAILVSRFSEEYSSFLYKRRFSFFVSLFAGMFGLATCYRFNFKSRNSIPMFLVLFGSTFYGFSNLLSIRMRSKLNKFAKEIADKYIEIKYTQVEYGNVNI